MSDRIGTKGFWIDDNEYCEIVGVLDERAGIYEFCYVPPYPEGVPEHFLSWVGFIEDFFEEC